MKALVAKVLDDPALGINAKLDNALAILKKHGLATDMVLKPSSLLCHPQNRGGSMVNTFDVHRKGEHVVSTGLKHSLLAASSVCIEIARDPAARKEQMAKNQSCCDKASGLLGGVQGQEAYLTLGCSHWVMYCRALEQGAMSPNGDKLHVPSELKGLLNEGWQWVVLKPEVEEAFPTFPSWAAASLNSSNANVKVTSELEAMLEIASLLKQGRSSAEAVEAVKAGLPACAPYLVDIAHFVKLYAGGNQFPLLQLMKDFCTKYGPSILIGSEMMHHLSHFDFRMDNNRLPMTRAALLCCMLTTKKCENGLSRLVYKSDLDKLKGALKSKTKSMEDILKNAWEHCQQRNSDGARMAWGKLGCRVVLHILGKEKHSRDPPFESVEDIVKMFGDEVQGSSAQSAAASSNAETGQGPEVKDLLSASSSELALLDNPHLKLGGFYQCKDYDDKVFVLVRLAEDHMVFTHTPVLDVPEEVQVEFSKLKTWKATKRQPPKLCPSGVASLKIAHTTDVFKAELKKTQLQLILLEAFQSSISEVHGSLLFASMPGPGLFCSQKLKKGQLVLYPMGTVQSLKGKDSSKVKNVILEFQQEKFAVQSFKSLTEFTLEAEGMLVPYHYVQSIPEEEEPNMEVKMMTVKGVKLPVLTNTVAVPQNTLLTRALAVENESEGEPGDEGAPKKKRKHKE